MLELEVLSGRALGASWVRVGVDFGGIWEGFGRGLETLRASFCVFLQAFWTARPGKSVFPGWSRQTIPKHAPATLKRTSLFNFGVIIYISSYRHLLR